MNVLVNCIRRKIIVAPIKDPIWVKAPIFTKFVPAKSRNMVVMANLMKLMIPIRRVQEST